MNAIEIARKLAALDSVDEARDAYQLALHQTREPDERLEAAVYILQYGGDYRISYTCFRELYNQGHFREELLPLMYEAFYEPNVKELRGRYGRNCKLLKKYPYLFRKDFPLFEELPIRFFPYDENGYVPFYLDQKRFGEYINFKNPVVSHNFFKDLDNPVLADDVYSQYELEYLNDNVRRSEDVGRENHVYLHYSDWAVFCAHLQCLDFHRLLKDQKLVFLIGDEIQRYPIDFKAEYGVDYSRYRCRRPGIREINRLIWHTQLSAHNGGDFFNEVFDSHPNLLVLPSIMMEDMNKQMGQVEAALDGAKSLKDAQSIFHGWLPETVDEVYRMKNRTPKDVMVAAFLNTDMAVAGLDWSSRIAPAVFFQPHFENMIYRMSTDPRGNTVLDAPPLEELHRTPFIQGFRYIKTFTPLRRFTTSHAASVRFMYKFSLLRQQQRAAGQDVPTNVVSDVISERVFNRSFMIDPEDRLYKDSVLVRFEDGKLNPTATFTALAAFLDLPYTESMRCCSEGGRRDPHPETKGFDPAPVYKTYDDYANDAERYFIEYFLQDAYAYYGYDFQYYDGAPVDEARAEGLISAFTTMDHYIRLTWKIIFDKLDLSACSGASFSPEEAQEARDQVLEEYIATFKEKRLTHVRTLLSGLRFVNKNGQPLRMMPLLKLDPALLEQPLYH